MSYPDGRGRLGLPSGLHPGATPSAPGVRKGLILRGFLEAALIWRRGSQSIPIERQSIFDLLGPKSTICATAENWRFAPNLFMESIVAHPTLRFPSAVDSRVDRRLPSRGKGHSSEIVAARQFLVVMQDDVPSAQLDRSCDIRVRAGLSSPRFSCSRRQLFGLCPKARLKSLHKCA